MFGICFQNHADSSRVQNYFSAYASNPPAAYDHNTTMTVALELSGKSWEVGAVVPGVTRSPRRRLDPRDVAGLLKQLEHWKAEATKAGRTIERVALTYEAGNSSPTRHGPSAEAAVCAHADSGSRCKT